MVHIKTTRKIGHVRPPANSTILQPTPVECWKIYAADRGPIAPSTPPAHALTSLKRRKNTTIQILNKPPPPAAWKIPMFVAPP